jgi:hypothetical protein
MATTKVSNIVSKQVSAVTGSYTEVAAAGTLSAYLLLYAAEATLVSVGIDTPVDGTSFLLPAGSSLELTSVPLGLVSAKAVTTAGTLYVLSA